MVAAPTISQAGFQFRSAMATSGKNQTRYCGLSTLPVQIATSRHAAIPRARSNRPLAVRQ